MCVFFTDRSLERINTSHGTAPTFSPGIVTGFALIDGVLSYFGSCPSLDATLWQSVVMAYKWPRLTARQNCFLVARRAWETQSVSKVNAIINDLLWEVTKNNLHWSEHFVRETSRRNWNHHTHWSDCFSIDLHHNVLRGDVRYWTENNELMNGLAPCSPQSDTETYRHLKVSCQNQWARISLGG